MQRRVASRTREKSDHTNQLAVASAGGALIVVRNFYKLASITFEDEIRDTDGNLGIKTLLSKEECTKIVCRMMSIYGKVKDIAISVNKTPYLDGSVFVEFHDSLAAKKAIEVYNKSNLNYLNREEYLQIIPPSCSWWFYQLDWVVQLCSDDHPNSVENTTKLLHDIPKTKRWTETMKTPFPVEEFPYCLDQLTCKRRTCEGGKGCHSLHLFRCTNKQYRKSCGPRNYKKKRTKLVQEFDACKFKRRDGIIETKLEASKRAQKLGQPLHRVWDDWKTWISSGI